MFRRSRAAPADTVALGAACVAMPAAHGAQVGVGCVGVGYDQAGRIWRLAEGARVALADGEAALCFHPGPYQVDITPFAAAPEVGLRLALAVDAADPRVAQQRFDLYLVAEVAGELTLASLRAAVESALRSELEQGNLALPPCTTLDEWNAFRAGLNQLLYLRFGVTVDDCVPVDLGETVDYAQLLRERAEAVAVAEVATVRPKPASAPLDAARTDVQALRRLFLELPSVMCALRLTLIPPGQALFRQQKALLQRLDLASLEVDTMPALALAAPRETLAGTEQARRARASLRAAATLAEAWAVLARLQQGAGEAQFDELDRVVANLEQALAERRATEGESA